MSKIEEIRKSLEIAHTNLHQEVFINGVKKRPMTHTKSYVENVSYLLSQIDKAREALKDIEEKGMGYVKNIAKKALEEME